MPGNPWDVSPATHFLSVQKAFAEELKEDLKQNRRRDLETAAVFGAGLLAWNVYRNHSGKRRP